MTLIGITFTVVLLVAFVGLWGAALRGLARLIARDGYGERAPRPAYDWSTGAPTVPYVLR